LQLNKPLKWVSTRESSRGLRIGLNFKMESLEKQRPLRTPQNRKSRRKIVRMNPAPIKRRRRIIPIKD
jgi:hypothetical protein